MEAQKINTAVVILNWNGIKWLKKFLQIIIDKSAKSNIYVADNNSDDDSVKYINDNFPQVNIIQNLSNDGYANGYNNALNELNEEYFALVNSDIEVTDNWIEPIISLMEKNDLISACQPKILNYNNKDKFEYAGASGGYLDNLGYPFCRGRIFDSLEKDENQYDGIKEVFWATGACLFVRSQHFKEVNGFDNDFFAHQEEIDLCWRLKNKGYKIMVNPESIVYHVGGGTLNSSSPSKTYLNFRNNLYMLFKNLPLLHLITTIFFRLILDAVAGITFITKKNGIRHVLAILRAHCMFYVSIPNLVRKRQKINQSATLKGKYDFSILYRYYIKGQKKYSDL